MSDFIKKWDKILSWEVANYPLTMTEKHKLHELPLDEFETELHRMAERYQEERYGHGTT